jgi:hypothetical protein
VFAEVPARMLARLESISPWQITANSDNFSPIQLLSLSPS